MGRHSTANRQRPVWRRVTSMLGIVSMAGAMAVAGTVAFADDPVTQQKVCAPSGDTAAPYSPDTLGVDQIVDHDADHGGSIIPSFSYTDSDNVVQNYPGLNWTTDNQAIFGNDCATPAPPDGAPVVTVDVSVNPAGPFNPGVDDFQYKISYACSAGLGGCPGATMKVQLGQYLDWNNATHSSLSNATMTYDKTTGVLTVDFNADLGGTTGLQATNGTLLITAHFLPGTADGSVATTCATISATGAAGDNSCVDVKSRVTPNYGVGLTKDYVTPATGGDPVHGAQGSGATTTLALTATVGGNQAATGLTVIDPDPNQTTDNDPFNSFDLTGFPALNLPSGVKADIQVTTNGSTYAPIAGSPFTGTQQPATPTNAGDVTGIKVVYSCIDPATTPSVCVDGAIPARTDLTTKATVKLRTYLRTDGTTPVTGSGTNHGIHNQARVDATFPGDKQESATDTADYFVTGLTPGVTPSKTISPDTVMAGTTSDITMTASVSHNSSTPVNKLVVTDGGPGGTNWAGTFPFKEMSALQVPADSGVTGIQVEVYDSVSGAWITLGGDGHTYSAGDTPTVGAGVTVTGVRWTYTGNSIKANTLISNSFVTTFASDATAPDKTYANANCVSATATTIYGGTATHNPECADFKVTKINKTVTGNKSLNGSTSGIAHDPNAAVKATLTGTYTTNDGTTIDHLTIVDPGTPGSNPLFFDYFDFTGFGTITAPAGTKWTVYVTTESPLATGFADSDWKTVGTYTVPSGGTYDLSGVSLPAGVNGVDVQGIKFDLTGGTLSTGQGLKADVNFKLRDAVRGGSTKIDGGTTVRNCVVVSSGQLTASNSANERCKSYEIKKPGGTGSGIDKNIVEDQLVQGLSGTTGVVLTGKNDGNVTVNQIALEDKNDVAGQGMNKFWDAFAFGSWYDSNPITWPNGTTKVTVEYLKSDGSVLESVSYTTTPTKTTLTNDLPSTLGDIHGLRITWDGNFAVNATVKASFNALLNDTTAVGTQKNCLVETYKTTGTSDPYKVNVTATDCDTINIVAQTFSFTSGKQLSSSSGTVGLDPAATTTATLTVTNGGDFASQPLDSITITEPQSGSVWFNDFTLTGFSGLTLPSGVVADVKVFLSGSATATDLVTDASSVGEITAAVTTTGINLATVTGLEVTFHGENGAKAKIAKSAVMQIKLDFDLRETGRDGNLVVPPATQNGRVDIQNCIVASGARTGGAVTSPAAACQTYTAKAHTAGISASKTWTADKTGTQFRDDSPTSKIVISGRNSGNIPLKTMTIQDPVASTTASPITVTSMDPAVDQTVFNYFDVTGLSDVVFPKGADQVRIDVRQYNGAGGAAWVDGTVDLASPVASVGDAAGVNDVPWSQIVGVRLVFSSSTGNATLVVVSNDQATADIAAVQINVKLRATERVSGDTTSFPADQNRTFDNFSSAEGAVDQLTAGPTGAHAAYTVNGGKVTLTPEKVLDSRNTPSASVNPDSTVTYRLQIKNTGTRSLVEPVVVDSFDKDQLAYDGSRSYPDGGYQFDGNGSHLTGAGLSVDKDTAGEVTFTFGATSGYLAPGETAYIYLALQTQPGLPAGTQAENTYGVGWTNTVNGTVACTQAGQLQGGYCTDKTTVIIQDAWSMGVVKWIKGDADAGFTNVADPGNKVCPDDAGFTHYPCIAHTHIDGVFQYKLRAQVTGNKPVDHARIIDVLPYTGDKFLIVNGQRLTEWTPTFESATATVTLPSGVTATATVYYATVTSVGLTPLSSLQSTAAGWDPAIWSTTPPVDPSDIKAIGIDVDASNSALQPRDYFDVTWDMRAPAAAPSATSQYYPDAPVGSIAWNSFAFNEHMVGSNRWEIAIEPPKVGIDLFNPSVTVEKHSVDTDGQTPRDGSFGFTLTQIKDQQGNDVTNAPAWPQTVATVNGTGSATWSLPTYVLEAGNTYRLSESSAGRYIAGTFQCTDANHPNATFTATSSGVVEFVALAGARVVCEITNTYNPPPPGTTETTPPTTTTPSTVPPTTSTTVEVSGSSSSVNPSNGTSSSDIEVLPSSEDIAYTGVNAFGMGALALLLLALGGGLLWAGKAGRRRRVQH